MVGGRAPNRRDPPPSASSGRREKKCEAQKTVLRFARGDKTRGSERRGLGLGSYGCGAGAVLARSFRMRVVE